MIHFKKQNFKIEAILFLIGIFFFQGLSATNVLKIGHYQVLPNTEFVIQLEAENSDPFVAFQADIPIPAGFSYVDGSAQLNSSRISGHSLSASLVTGNILRLIGYSIGNTAFVGNTGSIVNFNLKSGTIPGTFPLQINQPLLGNSLSVNILTSSTNGDVTVLSPNLKLSVNELNYGRVPLESSPEQSFQINNEGNRDLIISSLNINDSQFSTSDIAGFTISANSSRTISLIFKSLTKGNFSRQLKINSNDPDQPISTVTLNAVAFAVNEIHTSNLTGASSSTGKLDFTLNNMEAFTGFQFDLTLPQPMTYATGTAELFRSMDHIATVNRLNAQTLRVLVFSGSNKNFTGNDGKVLSLDFLLNGVAGNYSIGISNVIIANTLGENIVSASSGGQLQISSPDIDTPTHLNFGDVSILSSSTILQRIYNYGQEPLIINQLMFSNDYFKSTQTVPIIIQPFGYYDLPVEFAKTLKGLTTGTLRIISNDPDENPFTVQLSGNAFTPNYLLINTQTYVQGESKNLPVEIGNEEPFVAFQFDLTFPDGFTPDLNAIALTARKQDHVLAPIALSKNSLRILVYSPGQKAFTGKSGPVLNIPFKAEVGMLTGTYDLRFSNSLISNIKSENVLYSAKNGNLNILKLNNVPLANAGPDQSVNELAVFPLDGSASSDPDGNSITYKWTAPAGITLSSIAAINPTFIAPEVTVNTNYTFSLIVNDGTMDSPLSQVVITVKQVNKAPIANAGSDQSVNELSVISLDGSVSSDPDGNPITYKWTAPAGITLSSTSAGKPTFTAPEVTVNTDYTFILVVNDGSLDSPADQVMITIKQFNKAPLANAGPDQSVNEFAVVALDGSASSDPDGNPITYKWSAPAGITLSSIYVANPTFTAPEVTPNTDYTFLLVVKDGTLDSETDQIVVTVKQVNKAPKANAGPDQSVNELAIVTLDGSASSDPDVNPITYKWTAPDGITLSSTTVANPTFTASEISVNTDYTFSLIVNDGTVDSPVDLVMITVKQVNKAPVVNAGTDQSVNEGAIVTLDGSASSDSDGNPITYKWTAPTGITLSSTFAGNPKFTAQEVTVNTDYTFTLVVNDGFIDSPSDQVMITVKQVNKAPIANAGPDQSVNELSMVTLDGSASSDTDGNPITYKWIAPVGITLSSTTDAKPTFTAPEVTVNTNYTFTLVVNDGTVDSPSAQVVISAKQVNKAPLVNAGSDQSVNELQVVTLDGSASTDLDGNPITYKWSVPVGLILSSTTAAKPTFTAPEVIENTNYNFSLVVNDGLADSPVDQIMVTVKQVNKAPTAIAGTDQSVIENSIYTLDGSASSDPDNDFLIYKWTVPTGITLSSTDIARPTFTAPKILANTAYTFSLIVNDGKVDSPVNQVIITIKKVNNLPIVNAGTDQFVNEGALVVLDGTASHDPDNDPLIYKWIAPTGITLSSTSVGKTTFTAPEVTVNTDYTFTLVVNDGSVDSPSDQVVITVKQVNKAPIANAGPDQSVNELAVVTLDGSVSSDPDGNPITYKWTAPTGITLSSTTDANPTFTASEILVNTDYTFSLIVNDGTVDSPVDQVMITVIQVNKAPVANAGTDQSVNEGVIATLDGLGSSDPDNNDLIYKWTAPVGITLSSTSARKPTFIAPEVIVNTDYTFTLVVNDGFIDSPSDQVMITVKQVNKAPIANAGNDQSVNELSMVTLDGSASSDTDGNPITYKWTAPAGAMLSSITDAKPTFTSAEVTENTIYTFNLVVNDGSLDSPADQVMVTVKQVNKVPIANAGAAKSINEGALVTLDGSASTDPDGNPLTYKWSAPAGITLNSISTEKPTFTASEVTVNTNYTFSLIVNDGTADSPLAQVVITVKKVNKAPIANAGSDQSVNELSVITLDGSASSDPDGNPITYKWTAPAGITLSSTTTANPTFTAPEILLNTDYTFSLILNDGTVDSPVDQVMITVKQVNKAPVSNAGTDQSVDEGAIGTLDGSGSSDPDNNDLIYNWTAPAGITLSSTSAEKPTFTAPEVTVNTDYNFSLVVKDGMLDSPADQVVITVKQFNNAPISNAGSDQSVNELAIITLDGLGSSDPDGNTITYKWTAPAGITLSSTSAVKPTFTAPEVTVNADYSFTLVMNDGTLDSPVDQVVITVKSVDHLPYIKNAIQDVSVEKGATNHVIDLATVFIDDDVSDVVIYSVTSNSNNLVTDAIITNSILTLRFSVTNVGTTDIVITANSNGKDIQSKFKVEVKLPTGIDPIIENADVTIYPNPTKGKIWIKFNKLPKTGSWITVYDFSGKIISRSVAAKIEEHINFEGNSPGLYFIKIDQEATKTFKVLLK